MAHSQQVLAAMNPQMNMVHTLFSIRWRCLTDSDILGSHFRLQCWDSELWKAAPQSCHHDIIYYTLRFTSEDCELSECFPWILTTAILLQWRCEECNPMQPYHPRTARHGDEASVWLLRTPKTSKWEAINLEAETVYPATLQQRWLTIWTFWD